MQPFTLPLDKECHLIDYHPSGLWAIEKASGVLTHPNRKDSKERSLLSCAFDFEQEYYYWTDASGTNRKLYLIHRLDSATSGILIASSEIELSKLLKKAFENREVEKTYFCIAEYNGRPVRPNWKDHLVKQTSGGKLRVRTGKSGVMALTRASLERTKATKFAKLALLRLVPLTGRTHQLRVQCAQRKLPIIGDRTYGNFTLNRKLAKATNCSRLFLHAANLKVQIGNKDNQLKTWEIESPLPRAFGKLLA